MSKGDVARKENWQFSSGLPDCSAGIFSGGNTGAGTEFTKDFMVIFGLVAESTLKYQLLSMLHTHALKDPSRKTH